MNGSMPIIGQFKSKNFRYSSIPLFHMIITDNQSTELVYNLFYSKSEDSSWSAGDTRAVYWSDLDVWPEGEGEHKEWMLPNKVKLQKADGASCR